MDVWMVGCMDEWMDVCVDVWMRAPNNEPICSGTVTAVWQKKSRVVETKPGPTTTCKQA